MGGWMVKDRMEKRAHVVFPSFCHNLTARGHSDARCVRSRGAVLRGQVTPGACSNKANMPAVFLSMVCGEEPLCYLCYNYFLKHKLAAVSLGINLLSRWKASQSCSDAFPHLTERYLTFFYSHNVSHMYNTIFKF